MKIQTNTAANSALRSMQVNSKNTEASIQRLSSGFRINRAADDAAGLALANKLRADGKALAQAQKNAAQGSAMLQVMDGAVNTISTILDRMKELATQANSANVGNQAGKLDSEFQALVGEIGRITSTTKYQGTALVDGTFGATVDTATSAGHSTLLALGAVAGASISGAPVGTIAITNGTAGKLTATYTDGSGNVTAQTVVLGASGAQAVNFDKLGLTVSLGNTYDNTATTTVGNIVTTGTTAAFQVSSSSSYGVGGNDLITMSAVNLTTGASGLAVSGKSLTSAANASAALTAIDTAIDAVNTALGSIGAAESRFDFASTNVATMAQNVTAAESTIRDADMAYEMTQFTKNNILSQAAQSMLSQANQGQQGILQLLRG